MHFPPLLCYIKHTRYSIKIRWVKYDQIEKLRKHLIIVFCWFISAKIYFYCTILEILGLQFSFYTQTTIHTHTHTIFTSVYNNRLRISVHIVLAMYILIFTNIFFFTNELINIHVALKYTQKRPFNIFTENKSECLRQHSPLKWLYGYHKVSQMNVSRRKSLGGLESLETRVLRSTVGGGWGQGGVAR